jgi:site-specific DNA-methyltransferase (adenine-specific)
MSWFLFCDCMDYMRSADNGQFDLAIVDIPYGIGADKPSKKPNGVLQKNGSVLNVSENDYGKKNWDVIPGNDYFDELFRISKRQIIFGANYVERYFGPGILIWDKLNGDSDQFGCEYAYVSDSKRMDVVYMMWRGMIQGSYCGRNVRKAMIQQGNKSLNEKRYHPTQKPVMLYKWILQNYANKGELIFDSHHGSGSLSIACEDLGFDIVACENDPGIYALAKKRIQDNLKQKKMIFPE